MTTWTDPSSHNYATGEVVTAASLNTYVRDNLLDLDRRTTAQYGDDSPQHTTTSTSYASLVTDLTATCSAGGSGLVLVILTAKMSNSSVGATCAMSFTISGATTASALDTRSILFTSYTTDAAGTASAVIPIICNTGSNTFTAQHKVSAGTGTFAQRRLILLPLN